MNQWKDIPNIGPVLAGNLEKAGAAAGAGGGGGVSAHTRPGRSHRVPAPALVFGRGGGGCQKKPAFPGAQDGAEGVVPKIVRRMVCFE